MVILEPEGLYTSTDIEQTILSQSLSNAPFEIYQANLGEDKPYSDLPLDLRQRVNGLFVFRHWMSREDVSLFPNLKVVLRMGVGYDRLDRVALDERRVIVCNCPDYGTTEVADHAIALALSLRRGILLHHDLQRPFTNPSFSSSFWAHIHHPLVQRPSANRTFGILGLGRIGTATALRAKAFCWSSIIFYDPYVPAGVERALGIQRVRTAEELFERSDTLSVHCPLTCETKYMVNKNLVSRMKDGSVLVNTARGRIVDLDALYENLKNGKLAGVGLDTLPDEPMFDDITHPLVKAYRDGEEWLKGRMVVTPHAGFYSPESWEDIRTLSCETMRDVLLDGTMRNVIKVTDE